MSGKHLEKNFHAARSINKAVLRRKLRTFFYDVGREKKKPKERKKTRRVTERAGERVGKSFSGVFLSFESRLLSYAKIILEPQE